MNEKEIILPESKCDFEDDPIRTKVRVKRRIKPRWSSSENDCDKIPKGSRVANCNDPRTVREGSAQNTECGISKETKTTNHHHEVVASKGENKAPYQNIRDAHIHVPKFIGGLSIPINVPINVDFVPSKNISGFFLFHPQDVQSPSLDLFLNGRIVGRANINPNDALKDAHVPEQLLSLKKAQRCDIVYLNFKQMFGSHLTRHDLPLYHLQGSDVYICTSKGGNSNRVNSNVKIYHL